MVAAWLHPKDTAPQSHQIPLCKRAQANLNLNSLIQDLLRALNTMPAILGGGAGLVL